MRETREIGGYRIIKQIGYGGMSTVYEAEDGAGFRVALKLLHPALGADEEARRRIQREVSVMRRVRGAHVAEILDAETESDELFVVTELIDGPTLERDVEITGMYTDGDLADLARGLADALEAIHSVGVLHRDVKPSNVMISNGRPVLIDFGISQLVDDTRITRQGFLAHTPGYLDPRVIRGEDPDEDGDWWSLVAVLAFAATGLPPFGTGNVAAITARVMNNSTQLDGLAEPLNSAFRCALHPDRNRRLSYYELVDVIEYPERYSPQDFVRGSLADSAGMRTLDSASDVPDTQVAENDATLGTQATQIMGYDKAPYSLAPYATSLPPYAADSALGEETSHGGSSDSEMLYPDAPHCADPFGDVLEDSERDNSVATAQYGAGYAELSPNDAASTLISSSSFTNLACEPEELPCARRPYDATRDVTFTALGANGGLGTDTANSPSENTVCSTNQFPVIQQSENGAVWCNDAFVGAVCEDHHSNFVSDEEIPEWALPPRHIRLFVFVTWVFISIASYSYPFLIFQAFISGLWIIDVIGKSREYIVQRRLKKYGSRRGERSALTARMLLFVLAGFVRVCFAGIIAAFIGYIAGWAVYDSGLAQAVIPRGDDPHVAYAGAVVMACAAAYLSAWFWPSARYARLGARYVMKEVSPSRGYYMIWVMIMAGSIGFALWYFFMQYPVHWMPIAVDLWQ